MHTFTSCLTFSRASNSVAAICSSSSRFMAIPFAEVFAQCLWTHFSGYLVVVNHRRSQPARTKATGCEQRDVSVRRSLAGFNVQVFLHGVEQLGGALDVAGGPQA